LPLLDTLLGERQQLRQRPSSSPVLRLRLPVRAVVGQLGKLRLAAVADFRLQPRHLGIGRVQVALRLMHAVAGRKMRFPRLLGTRLGLAQAAFCASSSVAACASTSRARRSRSACGLVARSSHSTC
jgi:hypothetical protein